MKNKNLSTNLASRNTYKNYSNFKIGDDYDYFKDNNN